MVRQLVHLGCPFDKWNILCYSLLRFPKQSGIPGEIFPLIEFLLDQGAQVGSNWKGQTELELALNLTPQNSDEIYSTHSLSGRLKFHDYRYLQQKNSDCIKIVTILAKITKDFKRSLFFCLREGIHELIPILVENGADVNRPVFIKSGYRNSPLLHLLHTFIRFQNKRINIARLNKCDDSIGQV